MKYRKLRIAWSVAWGVCCLLIVVLWVRSYSSRDLVYFRGPSSTVYSLSMFRGNWAIIVDSPPVELRGANKLAGYYKLEMYTYPARHTVLGIGSYESSTEPVYFFPHSVMLFVVAVIAIAPLLPRRFSLRTLLIALTLAALGLGLIVYALDGCAKLRSG
jgi:hypothetical protein